MFTAAVDGNIPEGTRFLSRQIGDLPPKYFALSLRDRAYYHIRHSRARCRNGPVRVFWQ